MLSSTVNSAPDLETVANVIIACGPHDWEPNGPEEVAELEALKKMIPVDWSERWHGYLARHPEMRAKGSYDPVAKYIPERTNARIPLTRVCGLAERALHETVMAALQRDNPGTEFKGWVGWSRYVPGRLELEIEWNEKKEMKIDDDDDE